MSIRRGYAIVQTMPHLILEYSNNISEKPEFTALFRTLHTLLETQLPTALSNCKSRAIQHSQYHVGNGDPQNAFIHLEVKVLPGRTPEHLEKIGTQLFETLKAHFVNSTAQKNLQLTVELTTLSRCYFKLTTPL